MLNREILELPAPQFLADAGPMGRAMQVKQQDLCFGTFTLGSIAGLLESR